ncbi:2-C-methyl-D-erythritol 4-phosphate cytidylyltransferase [Heyndrickxia camelliae]|uniref:2-C-methyl-D-erythritol 4-phosphate cytidylyltransferase n=1 Tax=Heyndrickxia camelliae TaxID=1707093 RepID=A0A2N3LP03_9BACI|nr:2-C-methyl-D-erythritol 4-phosphate cytidylyltransferase [Heyndrickxia camelliae]PKR86274.1 2-C-methyl-D-erythritol 4-phosphate cytidylyltransferase [Heyndrickxia camelliae]
MKNHVIILASGNGERLGNHIPKQFIKISGKTIIEHTIEVFENNINIDEITIVVNPNYKTVMEDILLKNHYKKVKRLLNGGKTRKESSFIGLSGMNDSDKVLIHDAVRPFVSERIINDCFKALERYNAVDVAITTADTIIKINEDELIEDIPDRNTLRRGQTPQAFRVGIIKKAHIMSQSDDFNSVTDDCGLVVKYNLADVFVVNGETKNIKITYKEDLYLADRLFQLNSNKYYGDAQLNGLDNKVIVIFGGTKGIGESIYLEARKYGAIVYTFSRENGVDVTNYEVLVETLERVFSKEQRIDYIVNTAGTLKMGKIESREIHDIVDEININYLGAINVVKVSIPYLSLSQGGILLFTSSSYTRGRPLYSIYSSTKSALVNLVQGLSEEFVQQNIRINAINPERTNTPMRRESFGFEPIETLLNSEKVAQVSLQTLLSDLSGQVIDVRK